MIYNVILTKLVCDVTEVDVSYSQDQKNNTASYTLPYDCPASHPCDLSVIKLKCAHGHLLSLQTPRVENRCGRAGKGVEATIFTHFMYEVIIGHHLVPVRMHKHDGAWGRLEIHSLF